LKEIVEKENGLMAVVIMAEVWRRWGKVAMVFIHMVNVNCFLIFVATRSIKWPRIMQQRQL